MGARELVGGEWCLGLYDPGPPLALEPGLWRAETERLVGLELVAWMGLGTAMEFMDKGCPGWIARLALFGIGSDGGLGLGSAWLSNLGPHLGTDICLDPTLIPGG